MFSISNCPYMLWQQNRCALKKTWNVVKEMTTMNDKTALTRYKTSRWYCGYTLPTTCTSWVKASKGRETKLSLKDLHLVLTQFTPHPFLQTLPRIPWWQQNANHHLPAGTTCVGVFACVSARRQGGGKQTFALSLWAAALDLRSGYRVFFKDSFFFCNGRVQNFNVRSKFRVVPIKVKLDMDEKPGSKICNLWICIKMQ